MEHLNTDKRLLSLDFLRGIAIFMVILVHSKRFFPGIHEGFKLLAFGQMGCQLFFVASAFAISISWENHQKRNKKCFPFLKRRFASLAPGFYLMILVTFILNTLTMHFFNKNIGYATNRSPLAILCNLLFLHGLLPFCNNSVAIGGWYIGTTALLYGVFPLIFYLYKRYEKLRIYFPLIFEVIMLAICIPVVVISGNKQLIANNSFLYFNIITQLPCFAWGLLLWFQEKSNDKATSHLKLCGFISALTAILSIFLFFSEWSYKAIFLPFLMGFSAYLFLKILLKREERGNTFTSRFSRILIQFGKKSYYIYLVHGLFVWTMPDFFFLALNKWGITLDHTLLYLLFLLPMVVLSYFAASILERICAPITKWLSS